MRLAKSLTTLAALAAVFVSGPAQAQLIYSITKASNLTFGTIAPGSTNCAVTVSPNGTRSKTGTCVLISSGPGSAATFTVNGIGLLLSISLPSSVTMTKAGGGTMTVDTFVSNPSGTIALSLGSQPLTVGGTLRVAANQPVGVYTGTLTVTVSLLGLL